MRMLVNDEGENIGMYSEKGIKTFQPKNITYLFMLQLILLGGAIFYGEIMYVAIALLVVQILICYKFLKYSRGVIEK